MKWKLLQSLIAVGFVLANIHYRWEIDGYAVSVIGGMMAWYITGLAGGVFDRLAGRGAPPQQRRHAGQLDAWAQSAGLKDRDPERSETPARLR